jgi:integrase
VVPAFVLDLLHHQHGLQQDLKQQAGQAWQEHGLVFASNTGTYFHPNRSLQEFDRLLEAAALPHMRFHDLRHSAATLLLSMDVHPKVVQELLGHSDIRMTLDTYSHVLPTLQSDAMAQLHQAFGTASPSQQSDEQQVQ